MENPATVEVAGFSVLVNDTVKCNNDRKAVDEETAKVSQAWRSSDHSPAPIVRFSMPVNGTYYVVEAVPSSGAHVMAVVSAYISNGIKKDSTLNQVLNLTGNPSSSLTPEALHELLGADKESIPQPAEAVKELRLGETFEQNQNGGMTNRAEGTEPAAGE